MTDLILLEPEIPHNTGAIARTCACTGARLHLIRPLGFEITDRWVKRAGLDYWHLVELFVYGSLDDFFEKNGGAVPWLATTKAGRSYADCDYSAGAAFMLGKETAGLPGWLLSSYPERCIRIPMREEARSLNLSNAAAVLCYESLRQQGFPTLMKNSEYFQNKSGGTPDELF